MRPPVARLDIVTSYIEVWIEILQQVDGGLIVFVTSYIEVWIEISLLRY